MYPEYNPPGHQGLDIGTPMRTPILACAGGVVLHAGPDAGWPARGVFVIIDHGDGWSSRYLHLDEVLCSAGDMVMQGECIGLSGNSGVFRMPSGEVVQVGIHLHFEMLLNGRRVDPASLGL